MSSRIIEAKAVISAEDRASATMAAMAKRIGEVSKAQAAFNKAGGVQAAKMTAEMSKLDKKMAEMQGYQRLSSNVQLVGAHFRKAQAEAARLKTAMQAAGSAGGSLAKDYDKAVRAMDAAKRAYRDQVSATRDARRAIEATGLSVSQLSSKQGHLRRQVDSVTASLKQQGQVATAHVQIAKRLNATPWGAAPSSKSGVPLIPLSAAGHTATSRVQRPQQPAHAPVSPTAAETGGTVVLPLGMAGIAPLAIAYGAKRAHDAVVSQHHEFQQATLRQQAVLSLDKASQATMIAQAEKIGKDTAFSNADIVRAQTDIGGKLPREMQKPAIIEAITENTKNYALAMQVSMESGAEAIVGYMKSWGYDLSSPEAAAASSKKAANILVQQAKTTGAKHHDLIGATKFGAAPSRAGGFSEEMINAIEAQLIRVGYDGAMAGTFARAVATKLAVPSRQGMAAIAGSGIDYNRFRRPGSEPATAESLSKMLQLQFGRSLGKPEMVKVQEVLDDSDVMADKGAYSEKIAEILNAGFARKTKAGKVDVRQAAALTRVADQFYNVVSGGVDTQGLFMAVLEKGINAALARYLFGQEHGGRAIGLDKHAIDRDFKDNQNIPANRAEVIAQKMQEGAQGEWNKLIGSVQTFGVALGEATDATRAWTYKGIGAVFDHLTDAVSGKIKPNAGVTPLTADRAPWRLDTWHPDAIGLYERSMRAQKERMRDPEAARGRAFGGIGKGINLPDISALKDIEAVVKGSVPVDVTGKLDPVELKGKAIVDITVKAAEGAQVTGMRVQSSGNIQAEGTALIGRFGRN